MRPFTGTIVMALLAIVLALVAAACTNSQAPTAQPMSEPAQPDGYVGQTLGTDVTVDDLQQAYGASVVRVYRTGDMLTADYIEDRLNVETDEANTIVVLWMDPEGRPNDREPAGADKAGERMSGAQLTERFAGQLLGTDVTAAEIAEASGATVTRVYEIGEPLTDDYHLDRVNIGLDEAGRIVTIWRDDE